MKVLLIGSGGREHALAWKLSQSTMVDKIYCAPGNGGTSLENKCENVLITDTDELLRFALNNGIFVTVVGPEVPLVEGIVDKFKASGLLIFGPDKKSAMLEGSKAFAKKFMKKYGIKTAACEIFDNSKDVLEYMSKASYPIVIKADGLAAGKGVAIVNSFEEAKDFIDSFMIKDIFKGAGKKIVVEEFLEGVEASILAVTDGKIILPFLSAKDHKTIYEEDNGPNTGGMGVICPNPYCSKEVLENFIDDIMKPTLRGIIEEDMDYTGIIFFGIIITKKGVYLLEYNVRLGDPETQALLPLMNSDLMEIILHSINKTLHSCRIRWKNKYSCCVVAASKGYPGDCKTGFLITGINEANSKVFAAGVKYEDKILKTSGGRVLSVTSLGETLNQARKSAYEDLLKVNFEGIYYRKDIGIIR